MVQGLIVALRLVDLHQGNRRVRGTQNIFHQGRVPDHLLWNSTAALITILGM